MLSHTVDIREDAAMTGAIKREDAGRINKKLLECRTHLQKNNIYSCLAGLKDVLEKLRMTRMLPADEKQLHKDINKFQDDLSSSPAFRNIYGPVTFKDDDFDTSLDFMKQLIQIKEEEITAAMESQRGKETSGADQDDLQKRVQEIMTFVEKGDFSTAREMADKDEEAADALMESYNTSGIQSRKEKNFDRAITTFKKALFVRPEDEGLYYNMSRSYIGAGDWKSAKNAMEEALKTNPDFQEGIQLLAFINGNTQ
jgi:tetratricopeptide (TPR) repeat protein